MALPAQNLSMSVSQYLLFEESVKERHEYIAGRLFAMVGATAAHNAIVGNVYRCIYDTVAEAGCRAYFSDMKVWIEALQSFYYPDIVVSCEPFDPKSVYLHAPSLIFEVLSPSTADVDRREKLQAYRQLPSMLEYVLVYQDQIKMELYQKDKGNEWRCRVFEGIDTVPLTALKNRTIELRPQDIYRGLDFC
jgi:Uma2 family endonuclease